MHFLLLLLQLLLPLLPLLLLGFEGLLSLVKVFLGLLLSRDEFLLELLPLLEVHLSWTRHFDRGRLRIFFQGRYLRYLRRSGQFLSKTLSLG